MERVLCSRSTQQFPAAALTPRLGRAGVGGSDKLSPQRKDGHLP